MVERARMVEPATPHIKAGSARASRKSLREWISQAFTRAEDIVYVGLGLLLASSALVLLINGAFSSWESLLAGTLPQTVIALLDRILLILMVVEILYTVQVSFRQHTLSPEPFIIVGLIAAIRRLLVLTAEFSHLLEAGEIAFRNAMIELGLLTLIRLSAPPQNSLSHFGVVVESPLRRSQLCHSHIVVRSWIILAWCPGCSMNWVLPTSWTTQHSQTPRCGL